MSYKITVLKSEVTKNPKGYSIAEIAYKTDDGKAKGMKVLDYAQKDVFAVVKDAKPGDVLDADFEKNTKGFWAFKSLIPRCSRRTRPIWSSDCKNKDGRSSWWETASTMLLPWPART